MYQTSEGFANAILGDNRRFHSKIICNGIEYIDIIRSLKLNSSVCGGGYLTVGGAMSKYIDLELWNPEFTVNGSEMDVYIGLNTSDKEEWCGIGSYTAQTPKKSIDGLIKATAYDAIQSKMSTAYFSDLTYPADAIDVLNEISAKTGVGINTNNLQRGVIINEREVMAEKDVDDSGNEIENITHEKPFNGYMYREALGYIAMLFCKYAVTNQSGDVEFIWYEDVDYEIHPSRYYGDAETSDVLFQINKISCSVGNSELTSGTGTTNIALENPVMTQERLDYIYSKVKNLVFMPSSVSFLGDTRLRCCDIVTVYGVDGILYKVPIMNMYHEFDGGLKTSVASFGGTEQENVAKSPTMTRLDRNYIELLMVKEIVGNKANFDYVQAIDAGFKNLSADYGSFRELTSDTFKAINAEIEEINASNITADNIDAKLAEIGVLTANEADLKFATIDSLNVLSGEFETLSSKAITTENLSSEVATLGYATVKQLEVESAKIETLETTTLKMDELSTEVAKLGYATVKELESESARIDNLESTTVKAEELEAEVAELGFVSTEILVAEAGRLEQLIANTVKTDDLEAEVAKLGYAEADDLAATNATIASLTAEYGVFVRLTTDNFSAVNAGIESLEAETLKAKDLSAEVAKLGYATIAELNTTNAVVGSLKTDKLDAETASITYATIANLNATNANINSLTGEYAAFVELTTGNFSAVNASIQELEASKITTGYLESNYAKIDLANIENGCITTAMLGTGIVGTAQIADGSITDAKIVGLTANKITAGKLDAAVIEVVNLNAANITVGTINGQQIASGAIDTPNLSSGLKTTIDEAGEIAEEALQAAEDAQSTAEISYNKVNSKGEQLIVNGSGLMGNNTNFTQWTFDGAVANNSPGSFTRSTKGTVTTDEYFSVNPQNEYTLSFDVKSLLGKGTLYSMIMFYDADKLLIDVKNHVYNPTSTTLLAQDLKNGDTVIYLTDMSGWSTNYSYGFYLAIWNYTNSFGYTYPAGTYTKNRVTLPKTSGNKLDPAYVDFTNNTITLTTAYKGSLVSAGTPVSQGGDAATYKYAGCVNTVIGKEWKTYTAKYTGVDYSGGNVAATFPPGTAYARVGFLWNNNNTSGETIWITNVSVYDSTNVSEAKTAAGLAQTTADGKNTVFYQSSIPSTTGRKVNDIWFDTDDSNRMYYFDGSKWTSKQFGTNAIANAAITNALIADATIQSAKIANLDAGKITSGYINAGRIQAGTIATGHLASDAVTSDKIAAGAITADSIAAGAITTDKIVASAITGEKIAAETITANNIATGAITASELSAGAVTTDKLAANAVTAAKIDVTDLFAQDITATGTISGANLFGAKGSFTGNIESESGNIGGWGIVGECLYSGSSSIEAGEIMAVFQNLNIPIIVPNEHYGTNCNVSVVGNSVRVTPTSTDDVVLKTKIPLPVLSSDIFKEFTIAVHNGYYASGGIDGEMTATYKTISVTGSETEFFVPFVETSILEGLFGNTKSAVTHTSLEFMVIPNGRTVSELTIFCTLPNAVVGKTYFFDFYLAEGHINYSDMSLPTVGIPVDSVLSIKKSLQGVESLPFYLLRDGTVYTEAKIYEEGVALSDKYALKDSGGGSSSSSLEDLGITATATELNYVKGVTRSIQDQLDGKLGFLETAFRATSDAVGNNIVNTYATKTELEESESDVQTQLNALDSNKAKNIRGIYYGTCDTAAGTAAKVVDLDDSDGFELTAGAVVVVKFTNANSVTSPTLNVAEKGAKPIYRYGTTVASTGTTTTGWRAGAVQIFVYDGTGWVRDFWENTTYSNVSLGQGYATCATPASTVAKTATLSSYALTTGGIVAVKFTGAVPANSTLNINSKGAKPIYYRGAAIVDGIIKDGDVATFIYNGSQYHLLSIDGDRFYSVLVPRGTSIPANADLNTTNYLKVGNYYCSKNDDAKTLSNCPTTSAFMMTVSSPLSTTVDNETTKTWVYRLRKLQVYTGAEFVQYCYAGETAGTWTYGAWEKVMKSNHFAAKAELESGTKIGSVTIDGDVTNFYTSLSSLGITATATELNYVDGVTSNIQTQLNNKLSTNGTAAKATADANGRNIVNTYATKEELNNSKALPSVTTSDNGAFLRVVNGAWAKATVGSAEEVWF